LTLSAGKADDLVELASGAHSLPRVLAALSEGRVDPAKARVLVEETDLCQPEERGRIIDLVLPDAEFRTTGSLRDQLRKLLYQADPDSVHKRYQKAVRERGVELRSHRDADRLAARLRPAAGQGRRRDGPSVPDGEGDEAGRGPRRPVRRPGPA